MGFLDEVVIRAVSGDGGRGCVSFRREKFIPKGGPDGGDGGNGGNITIRATTRLHTLYDFSSKKHFKAKNGQPGKGKRQAGKYGPDIIIDVPIGTIVYDNDSGDMIADLILDNQEILILKGGEGGQGNCRFATSTNRAPRHAQPGLPGQEKRLRLSLKYLADVGLIGLPNAGKSTLLSRLTMANPKIDNYPFTTIIPNLGVIEYEDNSTYTIADIPGLIEGASEGKGLGYRFLRHIERTGFLLHLIDITHNSNENLLEDFNILQNELTKYSSTLTNKDSLVVINKIDKSSSENRDIKSVRSALKHKGIESIAVSAKTGEGLDILKKVLKKKVKSRTAPII